MSSNANDPRPPEGWRERVHEVIFEADTRQGRIFDVVLMVSIVLSVITVSLESIDSIHSKYGQELRIAEWGFTLLFTLEYVLRLASVRRPHRYAFSAYGLIDFIAIMPTYLSFIVPNSSSFLVLRSLRLLRAFRVLKLTRYFGEASALKRALIQSRMRIVVFLFAVFIICIVSGALLYFVEGERNDGFTSIPQGVYWAIVTLTSTGYGDTVPITPVGKAISVFIMMMGYSLIIVPTGIISTALMHPEPISTQSCPSCSLGGHDYGAKYCKHCGSLL